MLPYDVQKQVREALQQVDQALAETIVTEAAVLKQAHSFRDTFFGAFEFIENESLNYRELQVQFKRIDNNQIQVQSSKGRKPFMLYLDPEPAYDSKPLLNSQESSSDAAPAVVPELAARLFAIFAPPNQGLLRYYTIFADGLWKRTTFTLSQGRVLAYNAHAPRFNAELLTREAVDLLGYICTLQPTWDNLAPRAETFTLDMLQERDQVKTHLTGLGVPRHTSKKSE